MIDAVVLLGAVGLVIFTTGLPVWHRSRLARRVEPYISGLHGRPSRLLSGSSSKASVLGRAIGLVIGRYRPDAERELSARLEAAGLQRNAGQFRFEQLLWALAATVAMWIAFTLAAVMGISVDGRAVAILTTIAATIGFLGRDWWLTREVQARRERLEEELPIAIDLVTLAIMSGESVPAALARAGRTLSTGVGGEFERVMADIRAGTPVDEALQELKSRLPVTGVGRLVDALCTGIERGAPLADILRAQADDGREARRRYLLEAGGRREVLMLIPVVFLILPVVVVFTLYPGLVSLDLLVR